MKDHKQRINYLNEKAKNKLKLGLNASGWRGMKPTLSELKMAIKFNKDGTVLDGPIWTICEVLRQIWALSDGTNKDKIRQLVAHATVYAKRMDGKLRKTEGTSSYSKETFPPKTHKEKEQGL